MLLLMLTKDLIILLALGHLWSALTSAFGPTDVPSHANDYGGGKPGLAAY